MHKVFGEVVQALGLTAMLLGITLECILGADIWYIAITFGSLAFAVGTKVKYYRNNNHGP